VDSLLLGYEAALKEAKVDYQREMPFGALDVDVFIERVDAIIKTLKRVSKAGGELGK